MSRFKSGKCFFSYAMGVVCWLMLFAALKWHCTADILKTIDSLWLKKAGDGLVINLLGNLAFHADDYDCEEQFIYSAHYYPNGMDGEYKISNLTDTIDMVSWKKVDSDAISTTYVDKSFKYIVYSTSDGVYMRIFQK